MSGTKLTGSADVEKTTTLVLKITCICWLFAKLISWKLWLANRTFPLLPAADFLALPGWIHLAFFILSLLLIIFLIARPAMQFSIFMLFVVEAASCLLDQNRLQPWQYQYITMLLILLLYYKNRHIILSGFGFIIFSTYLFSGISKLNPGFIENVWQKTILLRFFGLPLNLRHNPFLSFAGYGIPLIEIVGAAFLLFKHTRKTGAIILILANVFNLVLLGPVGIRYNVVVWPWNICMIGIIYVLFARQNAEKITFLPLFRRTTIWIMIVWGLLPITNPFGFWDDYLSSALYSGRAKHLVICLQNNQQHYPAALLPFSKDGRNVCPGSKYIVVNNWALREMNVPCYPELRVFKTLEKELTKRYAANDFIFKVYNGRDTLPH